MAPALWAANPAQVRPRDLLAGDPHRPIYHFLPPTHWMNDPNGLIQWGDDVHLFYQYNPNGAFHGTIHWGHAVSRDLVHWQDLPVALAPEPGSPDANGCWSGCAVDDDGTPTIFYTGDSPQCICLATGGPDLATWRKDPRNPIVTPPAHLGLIGNPTDFRDPWVWREDGVWNLLVGTGTPAGGGMVLLYRAPNLTDWELVGPVLEGRLAADAGVWECPNLFPLDGSHVLLISEQFEFLHTYYLSGEYTGARFAPARTGKTDHGRYFYAALTFADAVERRLMFGWIKEGRSAAAQRAAGWAGVLSLPRVLSLLPDGRLGMAPAPEVQQLRRDAFAVESVRLEPGSPNPLAGAAGDALEIEVRTQLTPDAVLRLALRAAPGGEEETVLTYDAARAVLTLDTLRSSLGPECEPERAVVDHRPTGGVLALRIFVDRSVVEVFAGESECLTGRIYPTRPDSTGLALTVERGATQIHALTVWRMASIW